MSSKEYIEKKFDPFIGDRFESFKKFHESAENETKRILEENKIFKKNLMEMSVDPVRDYLYTFFKLQ